MKRWQRRFARSPRASSAASRGVAPDPATPVRGVTGSGAEDLRYEGNRSIKNEPSARDDRRRQRQRLGLRCRASRTATTTGTLAMDSRPPFHLVVQMEAWWKPHGANVAPQRSRQLRGIARPACTCPHPTRLHPRLRMPRNEGVPGSSPGVGFFGDLQVLCGGAQGPLSRSLTSISRPLAFRARRICCSAETWTPSQSSSTPA
jgi:hypothetical protein